MLTVEVWVLRDRLLESKTTVLSEHVKVVVCCRSIRLQVVQ